MLYWSWVNVQSGSSGFAMSYRNWSVSMGRNHKACCCMLRINWSVVLLSSSSRIRCRRRRIRARPLPRPAKTMILQRSQSNMKRMFERFIQNITRTDKGTFLEKQRVPSSILCKHLLEFRSKSEFLFLLRCVVRIPRQSCAVGRLSR